MIIKSSFSIGESPISSVWRKAPELAGFQVTCPLLFAHLLMVYFCDVIGAFKKMGKKLDIVGPLFKLMAAFADVFVFLSQLFMVRAAKSDDGFVFVYVLVFVVVFVC